MSRAAERFKYEIGRYISDEKSSCIDANSCDYKCTSEYELEQIEKNARTGFARACKLLDSMTDGEQGKLRKYAEYRLGSPYLDYKFVPFWLKNRDPNEKNKYGEVRDDLYYVGPLWLKVYDDFVKARELTQ